jgi:hypothetical protein
MVGDVEMGEEQGVKEEVKVEGTPDNGKSIPFDGQAASRIKSSCTSGFTIAMKLFS